ncbi:hypothetical protein C8R45DRAFT_606633 [Mycena sanguinolenta]|nr:hypothetical protein C8R45DRAFT_606633 [Mycena sanguinolenta]
MSTFLPNGPRPSSRVISTFVANGFPEIYRSPHRPRPQPVIAMARFELKLEDLPQTLTFLPREYPLLEKISIVAPAGGLLVSFLNAPKLSEAFVSPYTAHIHLPRRQLTAFGSQNMDVTPFWGFVRDASNLVECIISIRQCDPSVLPRTVLSLPKLQSLALGLAGARLYPNDVAPTDLLNVLNTPALKSLSLAGSYRASRAWDPNQDITPIQPFVARSSFQLHSLSLSFFQTTIPTLSQCLRAMPSLVHLKLKPIYIDFSNLLFELRSNQIVPQLESLHLVFPFNNITVDHDGAAVSLAATLLHNRWSLSRGAQLQSFRLAHETDTLWFTEALKAHPDFDRLEAEGMSLYAGKAVASIDDF